MRSDAELARDIHEESDRLNEAIEAAEHAGYSVDLRVIGDSRLKVDIREVIPARTND